MTCVPQPGPSGVALLALAAHGDDSPECRRGIDYLRQALRDVRAGISLGWGVLGLRAWDACPPEAASWLGESYRRCGSRPDAAVSLALLLLAASEPGSGASDQTERGQRGIANERISALTRDEGLFMKRRTFLDRARSRGCHGIGGGWPLTGTSGAIARACSSPRRPVTRLTSSVQSPLGLSRAWAGTIAGPEARPCSSSQTLSSRAARHLRSTRIRTWFVPRRRFFGAGVRGSLRRRGAGALPRRFARARPVGARRGHGRVAAWSSST